MAIFPSQFRPDRQRWPGDCGIFGPLSDAQVRQKRRIILLFCVGGAGVACWIIIRIYALAMQGLFFFAPIFVLMFALSTLVPILSQRSGVARRKSSQWRDEKALSPEDAAKAIGDMSLSPESDALPEISRPSAPPPNSPLPKSPKPLFAEWVLAISCVLFGIMLLLFPLAIFIETLHGVRDSKAWAGFAMALLFSGSMGIGLMLAARFILTLRRNEWLRQAAQRAALCGQCGYDVRGVRGNCPECGHPIPVVESAEQIAERLKLL